MRSFLKSLALGGLIPAFVLTSGPSPAPVHAAPTEGISLLKTLSEWKYPGSDMPSGATMSDGGNPSVQSVKCTAILTTPDPVEKVIAFYAEKLGNGEPVGSQPAKPESTKGGGKSVSVQDDSRGRPVTLRVFVVNRGDTSTTLVISRAEGEKETHIAWSHYIRLGGGDRQANGAEDRMRFSLNIYSGRRDPSWETSDQEVKKFTAKFDALKARDAQSPLNPVLGYRGFSVEGFRSYDRVWVWKGTVEATRDGRTYQWNDEGRALEKYLLESSMAHISDRVYKMAADEVEEK